MIIFVDMEPHGPHIAPELSRMWAEHTLKAKYRLEEIAECPVLIVRHDRFTADMPARMGARAVILGGHLTEVSDYAPGSRDAVLAYAADPDLPLLGICGGHQLIAEAHGGRTGPIAPGTVPADDLPCLASSDLRAIRVESPHGRVGYLAAHRAAAHPLFDALPERPRFLHVHYWHVAEVPPGFRVLARSADGVVQAMAHESRPIFGTQFHPEGFSDDVPEGAALLAAFLHGDWTAPRPTPVPGAPAPRPLPAMVQPAAIGAMQTTVADPLGHAPEHHAPLHAPSTEG
jgi:GMP synthase-like glutamine amidotransferase